MKEYKENVVKALIERTKTDRIIHLKQTAQEIGVDRLTAQEAREVLYKAAKLTGYRVVEILPTERTHSSMWEHGALLDTDIAFEDAANDD